MQKGWEPLTNMVKQGKPERVIAWENWVARRQAKTRRVVDWRVLDVKQGAAAEIVRKTTDSTAQAVVCQIITVVWKRTAFQRCLLANIVLSLCQKGR